MSCLLRVHVLHRCNRENKTKLHFPRDYSRLESHTPHSDPWISPPFGFDKIPIASNHIIEIIIRPDIIIFFLHCLDKSSNRENADTSSAPRATYKIINKYLDDAPSTSFISAGCKKKGGRHHLLGGINGHPLINL